MAKRKYQDSFNPPSRNRGEEFNEPKANLAYHYSPADAFSDAAQQRAPRRKEIRNTYEEMYELEQRRNQRTFARTQDPENEFYAGVDPRRKRELADGGMVREDLRAMANLPRQAIHCEYPRTNFYDTPYLDDVEMGTMEGRDDNGSSMARYLNPRGTYPSY